MTLWKETQDCQFKDQSIVIKVQDLKNHSKDILALTIYNSIETAI